MNNQKGIVGAVTTVTGSVVAWLPVVNEVVQILAGLTAIIVGIATVRHYQKKDRRQAAGGQSKTKL
jgi:hypothetical protein